MRYSRLNVRAYSRRRMMDDVCEAWHIIAYTTEPFGQPLNFTVRDTQGYVMTFKSRRCEHSLTMYLGSLDLLSENLVENLVELVGLWDKCRE